MSREPEGDAIEFLWHASHARAGSERAAAEAAARRRALNDRMHRTAMDTLEASHREQLAAIEAEFRAEVDRVEDVTVRATRKVDADEIVLRTHASRLADDQEERIQHSLQRRLWAADSVLDGALPALKEARANAASAFDRLDQRVEALEQRALSLARSYRQRLPAPPPDAAETSPPTLQPGDHKGLEPRLRDVEAAVGALASCRIAKVFRGPILVVPLLLLAAAGAVVALALAPAGGNPGTAAAAGAAAGSLACAAGIACLFLLARREVRAAGEAFLASARTARTAIAAVRKATNEEIDRRESAARRTRDAETTAAESKYKPKLEAVTRKLSETNAMISRRVPHYKAKILRQRAENMAAAEIRRDRLRAQCDERHRSAIEEERNRTEGVLTESAREEAEALADAHGRWRAAQARFLGMLESLAVPDAGTPSSWQGKEWEGWAPSRSLPHAVRIGSVEVRLSDVPDSVSAFPDAAWPDHPASGTWQLPIALRAGGKMSLCVSAAPVMRQEGLRILQSAVARLLAAVPPGKARFTFVDPVGLGQSFAGFMHLADEHPLLVTDRIWTDPRHVEQRLADLTEHMETVIQKYLRNEYPTLEDYNRQAGEIAEPFRFLVMADFPTNVSDGAAKRLTSILQSGARCGVHVLLLRDPRQPLPPTIEEADLAAAARLVRWTEGGDGTPAGWSVDSGHLAGMRLAPDPPPDDSALQRLTRMVGHAAKDASRVEVPFRTVTPPEGRRWTQSTADRLRIPIGRAGANRLQHLALGEGTCQHALVAGKTGSGKSSLLNAMIVNSALWHSPSELELWLIDFKKGVEFKAYATAGMPHVRVVAVESDREFGLSVLQGLDDELRRRGELFRSAGVQSISDWRALGRGEHMPRSLLVVDEFQELFIEDDKVAQDSALLLDRLVRQGRAFGMHAVLGSQTLGGAYGIARSTMGQMGVRIALQCAEADSQLILSDDNAAARLLSRPGEAIYNDAGGRLEGNNPFQVVWLPDEERAARLREIADGPKAPAGRPAPIVFEGNLPADPGTNAALAAALAGTAAANPGPRLWLGDPVSIKEPTAAVLPRRSGSNLVVIGQSEESGPALLAMSMIALAAQHPPGGMAMTVLEGLGAPGSPDAPLTRAAAAIPAIPAPVMVLGPRSADDALLALGQELARRLEPGAPAEAPHFLVIDGLHRFRSLRRNENDFSFDDSGPKTPDRILALLLKEGPAVGMHVLAWVDTVANLQRAFDRNTLREINWKVLFQMSANDSSTIIDSPAASRLGPHRAILSDDDAGILEKFRPYPMPDAARLARFADALRRRGS